MNYKILKSFKGSQDGRFAESFEEGEEYDLSEYLVSCIPSSWVRKVKEFETPEDAQPEIENQAMQTPKRKTK